MATSPLSRIDTAIAKQPFAQTKTWVPVANERVTWIAYNLKYTHVYVYV